MKRIKALPLLIVAAIVGAALVAPAGASAVQWGGNNGESGPIEFNGNVEWNVGGSGLSCPVHAAGTLFLPGNTGEITEFDVDGTGKPGFGGCFTFGGYAHCVVTGTGTVPLSLEAKSTKEILITKPGKLSDKILWTWTFANENEINKCGLGGSKAGETWKIKADLPVVPIFNAGFLAGVEHFTPVEIIKIKNGSETVIKSGFTGEWAVTPAGTYSIF
jgi:hypothetical protein